jgi:hypothetical protein
MYLLGPSLAAALLDGLFEQPALGAAIACIDFVIESDGN